MSFFAVNVGIYVGISSRNCGKNVQKNATTKKLIETKSTTKLVGLVLFKNAETNTYEMKFNNYNT